MLGIPFLDAALCKLFRPQTFDDPVDRLNYFVTPSLLAFFALMVSAKQYVGSPIQCWVPMEFKSSWEEYAEDYCFVQNTYYIPHEEMIPEELDKRRDQEFGYYQWVPIMLALQAVMFYIPNWIWRTMHRQSGLDLDTAITDAQSLRSLPKRERSAELEKLNAYVVEALEVREPRRSARQLFCFRVGRSLGSYIAMLYLITKFLNLVNVCAQFYLLNVFIGTGRSLRGSLWGWHALQALWFGEGWEDSPIFPRVSLCDFTVRRLANLHRYTIQCVLMINMFNEKIYLFLWFWFLFVGVTTAINFLYCLWTLGPPSSRERAIRRHLKERHLEEHLGPEDADLRIAEFTDRGLRPDGVLLLRFVEGHAGAIVAREMCQQLFDYYDEYATAQRAREEQAAEKHNLHHQLNLQQAEDEDFDDDLGRPHSDGDQKPSGKRRPLSFHRRPGEQFYHRLPPMFEGVGSPAVKPPGSQSTNSTSPGGGGGVLPKPASIDGGQVPNGGTAIDLEHVYSEEPTAYLNATEKRNGNGNGGGGSPPRGVIPGAPPLSALKSPPPTTRG